MGKINGTLVLVYVDGTVVAAQKNCTVNFEQDLPDKTSKDSGGWAEHANGVRSCTMDFDALYSTTGASAEKLITYITGRTPCVLVVDGAGFPIVGEARPGNVTINAPMEEMSGLSGTFTFDGPAWMLTGTFVNLMTDPDGTGTDFDVLEISGIKITRAIAYTGDKYIFSNSFSVTTGDVIKVITHVTLNTDALPSVAIARTSDAFVISNVVVLTEGVNVITLTCTDTAASFLRIISIGSGDWAATDIYLFKT